MHTVDTVSIAPPHCKCETDTNAHLCTTTCLFNLFYMQTAQYLTPPAAPSPPHPQPQKQSSAQKQIPNTQLPAPTYVPPAPCVACHPSLPHCLLLPCPAGTGNHCVCMLSARSRTGRAADEAVQGISEKTFKTPGRELNLRVLDL
jgi:hypothetical protein